MLSELRIPAWISLPNPGDHAPAGLLMAHSCPQSKELPLANGSLFSQRSTPTPKKIPNQSQADTGVQQASLLASQNTNSVAQLMLQCSVGSGWHWSPAELHPGLACPRPPPRFFPEGFSPESAFSTYHIDKNPPSAVSGDPSIGQTSRVSK